jgi:hypothetical protein
MDLIQVLCLGAIVAAVLSAIRLQYKVIGKYTLLLTLFGLSGIPDVLATVQNAYLNPQMEGNPLTKIFLAAPYLIVLGVFLWTLFWISFAEMLLRFRLKYASQVTLFLLFAGHAWGFSTWQPRLDAGTIAEIALATLATLLLLYGIYWMDSRSRKREGI